MDKADKRIFWGLVGASVLRNLASGAVMVFLPVYLFKLSGLWLVILWLAATRLTDGILMRDYARIVAWMGFKKSVLFGQLLWVIVMYFVNLADTTLWALIPAGLLITFAASAYWIPYHLLFMQTSEKRFGSRASWLNIFSRWSAAIGPILGGLVTIKLGFPGVFWLSAALMAGAAIPILVLGPERLKWDFHLDHYWEKLAGGWFRRDLLAFVGIGMQQAMYDFLWPVFLLAVLGSSYVELGAYKTGVLVITSVIQLMMGKVIDRGGTRKWMTAGIWAMILTWIFRGNLLNPWQLFAVDMIDGWLAVLVFLPFSVYTYRRAAISDTTLYVVESEASSRLGGFLAAGLAGLVYYLGWGWNVMVWVGVAGLGLMNFLPKIGPRQFEALSKDRPYLTRAG